MGDLSSLLNTTRIALACHISDVCINYVFYADDLCFMAPSATCMHVCPLCRSSAKLLNICYLCSIEVNLNFNAAKSFCAASHLNTINYHCHHCL